MSESIEIVEVLIQPQYGIGINWRNGDSETALQILRRRGYEDRQDCITLLTQAEAEQQKRNNR